MSPMDKVLFERWKLNRDAEAFRKLCDAYAGLVYGTCLRVLRNASDAEDASQECFERLASVRQGPRESMGAWLHTVATNCSISRIRSEDRRKQREERYSASQSSGKEPEWDDIYGLVDEAIAKLPVKTREALTAHFFEGKTHEAIAKEENVTRAAISLRIKRGIDDVRKTLRRKGVLISLATLQGLFGVHLSAKAAPVALLTNLSKLAISGAGGTGATVGFLSLSHAALIFVILGTIVGTAVYHVSNREEITPVSTGILTPEPSQGIDDVLEKTPQGNDEVVEATLAVAKTGLDAELADPANELSGAIVRGRVLDISGNGVAGAQVHIRCEKGMTGSASYPSDEEGYFEFRDVGPAATCYSMAQSHNPKRMSKVTELTELRAGEIHEVEFVFEEGQISGKVLDRNGRAVPHAHVMAAPIGAFKWGLPTADTDASGQFHFEGLFASDYKMQVEEFPGLWLDPEVRVTIGLNEHIQGIVLDMPERQGLVICGRVTDVDGNGIGGARVQANLPVPPHTSTHTFTFDDGYYCIEGLDDGEHLIRAVHQDYTFSSSSRIPAGNEQVNFTLSGRGSVEGRVLNARTQQPITRFQIFERVSVSNVNPSMMYDQWQDVEHPGGLFRLDSLAAGDYTIVARAEGFAKGESKIEIIPGELVQGAEIRLQPARTIQCTVVDRFGEPVGGAMMFAGKLPYENEYNTKVRGRTAADGTFELTGCDPDLALITVYHFEHGIAWANLEPGAQRANIKYKGPGALRIRVTQDGQLRDDMKVHVQMKDISVPLVGTLRNPEPSVYEVLDLPATRAMVIASIDTGDPNGGSMGTYQQVEIIEGKMSELEFNQDVHDTFLTVLVTEDDKPRQGLFFAARCGDDTSARFVDGHTTEDGHVVVEGLPPSPCEIKVFLPRSEENPEVLNLGVELRTGEMIHEQIGY